MRFRAFKRAALGAFCLIAMAVAAAPAQAVEFDEPLFLLRPKAIPKKLAAPPPASTFENPCGVAVDGSGSVYVSDYYHNTIDIFGSDITSSNDEGTKKYRYGYFAQFEDIDPVGGPCGLALDASGTVYYNEYHRSVVKNGTGVITGAPLTGEGYVIIQGPLAGVGPQQYESVPFSEAQPSPDGEFWRCKRPDGTRRCFFAPPPAT